MDEASHRVFCAALSGICANPAFFGPLFQQEPQAAVAFAMKAVIAFQASTIEDYETGDPRTPEFGVAGLNR